MQQIFKVLGQAFWIFYKQMPTPKKRKPGRPPKRGRKRKDNEKKENRAKVRACRWLVFKNPVSLTDSEAERLAEALHLCPSLVALRALVRELIGLFSPTTTTPQEADTKRTALLANPVYQLEPAFKKALSLVADTELFQCLQVYLHFENAVKTSNHVEGRNRLHRQHQKARYNYRSEASMRALLSYLHHRPPPPRTDHLPTAPAEQLVLRRLSGIEPPEPEPLVARCAA